MEPTSFVVIYLIGYFFILLLAFAIPAAVIIVIAVKHKKEEEQKRFLFMQMMADIDRRNAEKAKEEKNIAVRRVASVFRKNRLSVRGQKMKAEAVIFDKDGTLMEFDPFWVKVAESAVSDMLSRLGINTVPVTEILEAFGVRGGVSDTDAIIRGGTYEQSGQVLAEVLERHGTKIGTADAAALVRETFSANSGAGEIKGCAGLKETLCRLKSLGIRLAVVTTDSADITRKCLEGLGIEKFFDKIYTDDGKTPPKPEPYCAEEFLKAYGIKPENAVMIGDTLTDAQFAENAGMKFIAVASGAAGKELEDRAAAVIPDISGLDHIIEGRA